MLVTVWKGCVGVHEHCLLRSDGNYYGIRTRTIYPAGEYRHSPVYLARVVRLTDANETGMMCRDMPNYYEKLSGLIDQFVEVEQAHYYGETLVWRTVRERYYLSAIEIELVLPEPIR